MQPSVVVISTQVGEGSGVILNTNGDIITNNHVVRGATNGTVSVQFSNGKRVDAKIVGTDPKTDIAVVRVSGVADLTAAKFGDSDAMQVGDTVLAIGSPLGLEGSVSAGIVSALHRTISENGEQPQNPFGQPQQDTTPATTIGDALQTDAAINPGNSGGALVNMNGEVIGINTAIATSGSSSSGNIGVGFAISGNKAKGVAEQLIKGGKVSHPYLGVNVTDAEAGGAKIGTVVSGSPAEKGGLEANDVVTKIGAQTIAGSEDLVAAVQSGKVGETVQVDIIRDGVAKTLNVTLGDAP